MLLNVVDSCYVILTDLKVQIQENQKLEDTVQQNWKDIVWCEAQIQWRVRTIGMYVTGLSAMNTNYQRFVPCFFIGSQLIIPSANRESLWYKSLSPSSKT